MDGITLIGPQIDTEPGNIGQDGDGYADDDGNYEASTEDVLDDGAHEEDFGSMEGLMIA